MSIFNPDTKELEDFFSKAKYIMAWKITLTSSFIFLLLTLLSIPNAINTSIFSILVAISLLCLLFLKKTKNYNIIFWIYTISGTLIVQYSLNAIHNFTHFVDFLWAISIILIAFICLNKRVGLLFSVINIVGIIYFYAFNLNTHILSLEPLEPNKLVIASIEILMCMFSIGYLLHQYILINDYFSGKLKSSNAELTRKNDENIMLVKEIHHRVKNNLQIIISLLRLQKGELKTDESKRHFNEAINRIMVMSLIHKKLYQKVDMAQIEVQPYIDDLSKDVIQISNMGHPITCEVNSEIKKIGLKTIVPLGLLINELLSNSIKHAFKTDGYISISILKSSNPAGFTVVYADDGTWKSSKEPSQSFGLGLIQTLTEQLEGSYNRQQSEYTFELKNLDD